MIQALSFDAAGTLIEPSEPVAETYARLLSPHLGALDPEALGKAFPLAFREAGTPDYAAHPDGDLAERAWWRQVVEATLGQPVSHHAFAAVFDHYAQGAAWRCFEDVEEVLSQCKASGLRCVVISNFDRRLHSILPDLGLAQAFEQVFVSADAGARKPSAEIFTHALRRLALKPEEILHVGDSADADLKGATAIGIGAYLLQRPQNDLRDFLAWVGSERDREK